MSVHTFSCLDGHTCGNPVRLVSGGGPLLKGTTMSERRLDFLANHDWIRKALMFEPRGHDVMSGSILYPPTRDDCDIAILFIEVSGCLPMCGHGTIGTVTMAIENGLVTPATPGVLNLDAPAGRVVARYDQQGRFVESVRITNVASYLAATDVVIDVPEMGELAFDIAYGGNYYAILEPQKNFAGLESMSAGDVLRLSPTVRRLMN
jgi:4-hydroxyproline epimerase